MNPDQTLPPTGQSPSKTPLNIHISTDLTPQIIILAAPVDSNERNKLEIKEAPKQSNDFESLDVRMGTSNQQDQTMPGSEAICLIPKVSHPQPRETVETPEAQLILDGPVPGIPSDLKNEFAANPRNKDFDPDEQVISIHIAVNYHFA